VTSQNSDRGVEICFTLSNQRNKYQTTGVFVWSTFVKLHELVRKY